MDLPAPLRSWVRTARHTYRYKLCKRDARAGMTKAETFERNIRHAGWGAALDFMGIPVAKTHNSFYWQAHHNGEVRCPPEQHARFWAWWIVNRHRFIMYHRSPRAPPPSRRDPGPTLDLRSQAPRQPGRSLHHSNRRGRMSYPQTDLFLAAADEMLPDEIAVDAMSTDRLKPTLETALDDGEVYAVARYGQRS